MEVEGSERLILSPEDSLDDSDLSSSDNEPRRSKSGRVRAPRPSILGRQSLAAATKRRRRSSIIRNRLSIASHAGPSPTEQHLGELYRKAIRMNAENRINAQNSWNLPLIEHIDKFLDEDDEEDEVEADKPAQEMGRTPKSSKRVNFTKASCTLDASVKIYSFRVDDVHLTSYKVLANLNRNQKPNETDDDGLELTGDGDAFGGETAPKTPARKASRSLQTLETNRGNINMNRLDAAFDIDPLFHKMSKTFDEGGAKGLLLANLQTENCCIVFDSTEENTTPAEIKLQPASVDISGLQAKLKSTLAEQPLESLTLVPQLASLRAEYDLLESQGFVVAEQHHKTKRFMPSKDEEELADKSIHQEALERSTRTPAKSIIRDVDDDDDSAIEEDDVPGFNITPQGEFALDQYGPDDLGGGDDDDDYFIQSVARESRYSGVSFSAGSAVQERTDWDPFHDTSPSPTTVLLDALCSSNLISQSTYSYLSERAISQIENMWAGATHWKPARHNIRRQAVAHADGDKKKKKASRKKASSKERTFVCLEHDPDLSVVLQKPPKKKKGADPLLMSDAMIKKHASNLNLLPLDAGIGVDELSKLFLLPDKIVSTMGVKTVQDGIASAPAKSVAFDMTNYDSWGGGGDDDDGCYDEGVGYAMTNDDSDDENQDFCIRELDDVRRVEKVRVGYATVAKKVDVKRLKRDLWKELENRFSIDEEKTDSSMMTLEEVRDDKSNLNSGDFGISFQEAVDELEQRKSQPDATLSFYFISVLHLANEKGLRLESTGLDDFVIFQDKGVVSTCI